MRVANTLASVNIIAGSAELVMLYNAISNNLLCIGSF